MRCLTDSDSSSPPELYSQSFSEPNSDADASNLESDEKAIADTKSELPWIILRIFPELVSQTLMVSLLNAEASNLPSCENAITPGCFNPQSSFLSSAPELAFHILIVFWYDRARYPVNEKARPLSRVD